MAGLKMAWERDSLKINPAVQVSIQDGVDDVTVWHAQTPSDVRRYLVELANSRNENTKALTVIEVLESCEFVESSWAVKRDTMGWTVQALTQGVYEAKKKEHFNTIHPKRWSSHRSYEICQ